MDKLSPEARSRHMSRIRGKDTAPELRIRRIAHSLGLRFRLHRRGLPGSPDLVLPRWAVAVFVHGCFWHGHDCKLASKPKTRSEFWLAKFKRNQERGVRGKRPDWEEARVALGQDPPVPIQVEEL